MDKEKTEVTGWLKSNNASEFIDNFYNKACYYIKDLSEDVIRDTIPADKKNDAVKTRLIQSLKQDISKAKEKTAVSEWLKSN